MPRHQFFLILLFLIPYFDLLHSAGLRCSQVLNNDAFFTLEALTSSKSDYTYTYTKDSKSYILYYNFCHFTSRTCHDMSSYAVLFQLDSKNVEQNDTCLRLTSENLLSNYEYNLINPDEPSAGIQLKLTGGDAFAGNNSLTYQFTVNIQCSKDSSLPSKFVLDELTQDTNEFLAIGRSNDGCPVVVISEVYSFILDNKYIFGILSIFIGAIECFFGLRVLKPSLFIIGYLTGFGFLILIFGEFVMTPDSSVLVIWILLLISVFFGAITGYLATSLPKLGFMGLGLWFGFVLAFIINNLFLYKIEVDPPGLLLYILMAIFGIIFAILSMCVWRQICIMATSFLGSYLIIRSLSLYIGGYPNELMLDRQIKYKELANVGWQFYVYFVFLLLIWAAGAIVQFRNKRKIGGKFAGEFDNLDIEAIGEKYVEMDALEEAQVQKKNFSMINEENEELEVTSKKTPRTKKSVDDFQLNTTHDEPKRENFYPSKSVVGPKVHELEEFQKKKSFQGEIPKKGVVTPTKKTLAADEKKKGSFIEMKETNRMSQEESSEVEESENQSENERKKNGMK